MGTFHKYPLPAAMADAYSHQGSWWLKRAHVFAAWRHTTGDPDIIIGVPDAYFVAHKDLTPNIKSGFSMPVDSPASNHGSRCASIAVADGDDGNGMIGVAPDCTFIPTDIGEWGVDADAAIEACVDGGARIVTTSWGASCQTGCDYAWNNNALVIVACDESVLGGDNTLSTTNNPPMGPAATYPHVLNVSTIRKDEKKGAYVDFGVLPHIVAPSQENLMVYTSNGYAVRGGSQSTSAVATPYTLDNTGTSVTDGSFTSYASPLVAGVAALCLSVNPGLTNAELRQLLIDTSDDVQDPYLNFYKREGQIHSSTQQFASTVGCVNALKAVQKARSMADAANGIFPFMSLHNAANNTVIVDGKAITKVNGVVPLELGAYCHDANGDQVAITRVVFKVNDITNYDGDPGLIKWHVLQNNITEISLTVYTAGGSVTETYDDIQRDEVATRMFVLTNDTSDMDQMWHLERANVYAAWRHTFGDENRRIGYVDSGWGMVGDVSTRRPVYAYSGVSDAEITPPYNTGDNEELAGNHGSHMAAAMTARMGNSIFGAGPCQTNPLVFGKDWENSPEVVPSGDFSYLSDATALEGIIVNGNVKILCFSIQWTPNDYPGNIETIATRFSDVVTSIEENDCLWFIISQNSGYEIESEIYDIYNWVPLRFWNNSNIVLCAGMNSDGSPRGNYSTTKVAVTGPYVFPVEDLLGTDAGTSYGTPFVAGCAALMWSMAPDLTPSQIKQLIISSSSRSIHPNYYNLFGQTCGFVDAHKGVLTAKSLNTHYGSIAYPYINFIGADITDTISSGICTRTITGSVLVDISAPCATTVDSVELWIGDTLIHSGDTGVYTGTATYSAGTAQPITVKAFVNNIEFTETYSDILISTLTGNFQSGPIYFYDRTGNTAVNIYDRTGNTSISIIRAIDA